MHTNPAVECLSCKDKFLECDDRIISFVYITQHKFTDCHVSIGYRDEIDQELAFQTGKSSFEYPDSKHNNLFEGRPCSSAVDLFLLDLDGKALFPKTYYAQIYEYFVANRNLFPANYAWGGNWSHLKDYDHYEVVP